MSMGVSDSSANVSNIRVPEDMVLAILFATRDRTERLGSTAIKLFEL